MEEICIKCGIEADFYLETGSCLCSYCAEIDLMETYYEEDVEYENE